MNFDAALWLAVVALGLYHGLNPAMGWPLAVANGLAERRAGAVLRTLVPLGGGHFAAMAVVLLPVAALGWVMAWSAPIRLAAASLVLAFGLARLAWRRHPRALARIPPRRLAWWSFLMATAHGAGLMLVPVMLGLCAPMAEHGPAAAAGDLRLALLVAAVHTAAMLLAGVAIAWAVYSWLGLKFLRQAWINLDLAWAASLVVAGGAGIWMAV